MHLFSDDENIEKVDISSKRLALMNYDWSRLKAEDLFRLFSSFTNSGGEIISVKVYPTDFGLERMKNELERGPIELFESNDEKNSYNNQEDEELNPDMVRKYELERLGYYYAVIEFDDQETADAVYKECDGFEFENSGLKIGKFFFNKKI